MTSSEHSAGKSCLAPGKADRLPISKKNVVRDTARKMSNPSQHDWDEPLSSNSRPRILFIIDRPNWAHDFKTQNLARVLGHDYDILSRYQTEVTPHDLNHADLIVVYYWLQFKVMQSLLPWFECNRDKLLVGITSNWELKR